MDTLQLEVYKGSTDGSGEKNQDLVRILVNGQDLLDMITVAEAGYWQENHLKLAEKFEEFRTAYNPETRQYGGLYPSDVFLPSRRLFGDDRDSDHASQHDNGKVGVLMCTCGIEGCGSIAARITVSDDIVVWDGFEDHYHTEWDLSHIGPFIFDRQQYCEELRKKNPQRMTLAMAELKPSLVKRAAVFDVEHYYIDEAETGDYFEVWKDLQNNLSTVYYVRPGWQEVRIKVGEQYHKPENVLPEIIKYAERWGYKVDKE